MSSESASPLGIVAGKGDLPRRVIEVCRQTGRPCYVLALKEQTDPELVADVDHDWIRLGGAGEGLRLLRGKGVSDLVMVGSVRRPSLAQLRPDLWSARFLAKVGFKSLGDDGLLSALIAEIEAQGFRVLGVDDVLPDLLAPQGVLGAHVPDENARADISRGAEVARTLGALDVGQGAVVQEGMVLAVEAVEGTDAMLARCRDLHRDGPGGVLVKMKKPQQERRADLPTVGAGTVEAAAAAGLVGIAFEAGSAVILDREALVRAADDRGLFLVGLDANGDF